MVPRPPSASQYTHRDGGRVRAAVGKQQRAYVCTVPHRLLGGNGSQLSAASGSGLCTGNHERCDLLLLSSSTVSACKRRIIATPRRRWGNGGDDRAGHMCAVPRARESTLKDAQRWAKQGANTSVFQAGAPFVGFQARKCAGCRLLAGAATFGARLHFAGLGWLPQQRQQHRWHRRPTLHADAAYNADELAPHVSGDHATRSHCTAPAHSRVPQQHWGVSGVHRAVGLSGPGMTTHRRIGLARRRARRHAARTSENTRASAASLCGIKST